MQPPPKNNLPPGTIWLPLDKKRDDLFLIRETGTHAFLHKPRVINGIPDFPFLKTPGKIPFQDAGVFTKEEAQKIIDRIKLSKREFEMISYRAACKRYHVDALLQHEILTSILKIER